MKKKYIKSILVVVFLSSLFSCKKYLDVKPEDRVLEADAYSTQKKINSVLNGLYLNLANNSLYGSNLTLSTVDILAQRYNVGSLHTLYNTGAYAYGSKPTIDVIDNIWTSAYTSILNINAFNDNLITYKGVLDAKTDSIYRGEAIGMRAMLHFDMLRLFGPRYSTADSLNTSIPYYTEPSTKIADLLPANKVMDLILADLAMAEGLLKNDPIIANGVMSTATNDGTDFLRNRNYRFNYYAIKALQARVNLYRGNNSGAFKAAKVVLDNASKFPWVTITNALNEKANPDRVFVTEMISGIQNSKLYDNYLNTFSPDLEDKNILAPNPTRLATVFESNVNDYRYNLNWVVPSTGGKSYSVFLKYADVVDKTKPFRFTIPLVKISEMYYIAAETATNLTESFGYLNTVRNNRGLLNLAVTTTATLNSELLKEYQKEFYGEGQLFYYYKRRNILSIPNGAAGSGNLTLTTKILVLPLPISEIQYR
ncbi:RagB/SusD family nutrient uptake outer membrane protein [Pedobacter sp. MC2016-24]|uniref:RagB/SusD family nutrient uptake outer membrane protein n=1 Tax=Pedobacter sp. MC2016-24 TaxID=2780090 RepID=UPI0018814C50|nr:RagB/SusD family nutrient uptake outer membrane protein [Pedobacter sp. MC2016-24]MBE9598990.1 RagB/SusD family nutrient uptake outer membrane protein [Pedobacter sp. MC2016-24]